MALWDTAGNIINDAATELGLQSFQAKSVDPFTSIDSNIGQLCQLLKSVGRDLQRKREWTHLRASTLFTTRANIPDYDLPADFGRMISQTGWNRTNRLPLGGPLTPQEWQYLKGQVAGVVFTVLFRPLQGQLSLYPDVNTPGGYVIAYEYVSRFWCAPQGSPALVPMWKPQRQYDTGPPPAQVRNGGNIYTCNGTGVSATSGGPTGMGTHIVDNTVSWNYASPGYNDSPAASGDTILFDPQLVMRALKLAFLRAKGFDTTAAQDDFNESYEQACAEDTPGRVLNLAKTNLLQEPLIGGNNIPITGVGGQ